MKEQSQKINEPLTYDEVIEVAKETIDILTQQTPGFVIVFSLLEHSNGETGVHMYRALHNLKLPRLVIEMMDKTCDDILSLQRF